MMALTLIRQETKNNHDPQEIEQTGDFWITAWEES